VARNARRSEQARKRLFIYIHTSPRYLQSQQCPRTAVPLCKLVVERLVLAGDQLLFDCTVVVTEQVDELHSFETVERVLGDMRRGLVGSIVTDHDIIFL
jgi:hypothetical protein